jgi:2-polyprenyl-3-methyl-5-hydroxy-6-metoxy-1,4-benzoquinol methylase
MSVSKTACSNSVSVATLREEDAEMAELIATGRPPCIACEECDTEEYQQAPDRYHGRSEVYSMVRCRSCSLVWLQDPPAPAEMSRHYGPDYDRAVALAGRDPGRWSRRCEIVDSFRSSGTILDLGCSDGGFLGGLNKAKWNMYGIEMSPEVAKAAEQRTGGEVFVGDVLDAPFSPGTFDVITCFHVFEHLYQPRAVLAKVRDWLKPGGLFFAMMPNIDSAGARIFRSYWYGLELPRHLYHFSPRSLRTLARSVGLEEVSITTDREVFIEASTQYIVDDLLGKVGIDCIPRSRAPEPNLPFRILRKASRLTLIPVLDLFAALAGDGESIHAVLRKGLSAA